MNKNREPSFHRTGKRKAEHISICTDATRYAVENRADNLFNGIGFLHNPLPELAEEELDTGVNFLDHHLALPLFISCMTGGTAKGCQANRILAKIAQDWKIPVGMGSFRILFDEPDLFPQFHLKKFAPDVPVLGNIGIVQVREIPASQIIALAEKLEIQALAIHLNPGQELFQPGGDTDFRGLKKALDAFRKKAPFPLIIKETGFGIPPALIKFFTETGIDFIDLAGSGGTNWVSVESYRLPSPHFQAAREFETWGYPTPLLLEMVEAGSAHILASGGLRTGSDLAKSLALGARLGGMALPFIRAVMSGGENHVHALLQKIEKGLRSVMLLSGSANITALSRAPLLRTTSYKNSLEEWRQALDHTSPQKQ